MKVRMCKSIGISISLVLAVLVILIVLKINQSEKDMELSLESLKNNNMYLYKEIEWGISYEELKNVFPYQLQEVANVTQDSSQVLIYNTENKYNLDGQVAVGTFEFYDDSLQIIKFDFHLDDEYEHWFNEQVKQLKELYGEESQKMENSSDMFQSIGYRWDTDTTTLQLIMITGSSVRPSATLGVGVK